MVLLKIAIRNLFAHKVKTIIVGSLIALGVFMIVLGNSFLDSAQRGIQKAYSKSVTGQIAVLKNINFDYSLFGTWADVGNLRVPKIPDFKDTKEYLENHPDVANVTTVSSGFVGLALPGQETDEWLVTFGIEPESYGEMFDLQDAIELQEGRFLEPGEEGLVLPKLVIDNLEKYKGKKISLGDKVVLNGWSANGVRIREVPVVGIYKYRYLQNNFMPMLERTSFLDIQSYRILNGFTVSVVEDDVELLDDSMLFEENFDDLFSDTIIEEEAAKAETLSLEDILGDLEARHKAARTDTGAWQWFLIRTKDESDRNVRKVISGMEDHFQNLYSRFSPEEILKPGSFLSILNRTDKEVYAHIKSLFAEETLQALDEYSWGGITEEEAKTILAADMTNIITGPGFYDADLFETLYIDKMTKDLAQDNPKNGDLVRLNRLLLEDLFTFELAKGPDFMVSEWWHAAAPMSMVTQGIQMVLNIALVIIFIVTTIIIMNTLVISVMERTTEIGTIRALGGQKGFVFKLFVLESLTVSVIFGILGFILGSGVLLFFYQVGIPAPEESFMRSLISADVLYPTLSWGTFVSSVFFVGVIGLVSSLYPVHFALKVEPIKAIQND